MWMDVESTSRDIGVEVTLDSSSGSSSDGSSSSGGSTIVDVVVSRSGRVGGSVIGEGRTQ